jgi:hypothetical protein
MIRRTFAAQICALSALTLVGKTFQAPILLAVTAVGNQIGRIFLSLFLGFLCGFPDSTINAAASWSSTSAQ